MVRNDGTYALAISGRGIGSLLLLELQPPTQNIAMGTVAWALLKQRLGTNLACGRECRFAGRSTRSHKAARAIAPKECCPIYSHHNLLVNYKNIKEQQRELECWDCSFSHQRKGKCCNSPGVDTEGSAWMKTDNRKFALLFIILFSHPIFSPLFRKCGWDYIEISGSLPSRH